MKVQTEYGMCEIGIVQSQHAHKEYTCPLCESIIEIGERHYFTWPEELYNLRRHLHIECVKIWLSQGLTLRLHPSRS